MADTTSLFDTLSGAFGHPVDRPALNAFVANSQATNGLRTAQTEQALTNAQMEQDEMAARGKLEDTIAGTLGPNGKPMFQPSEAHMIAQSFLAQHGGKVSDAIGALMEMQKAHNTSILSNTANLGTPEATAAQQGLQGKVAEPVAVPKEYTVPAGMPAPTVNQTPLGAAETASYGATAALKEHQAHAPAGASLSDDAAYNAAVKYNHFGVLPPMGMGASAAADRKKVLDFAAFQSVDPNWHPPSWDGPQGAAPPSGTLPPTATGAPPIQHPTLATALDTAGNASDSKAQTSTLTDMTKRTSIADSSEQTALKNLDVARKALAEADQTGSPLANTIVNKIRGGLFGDPQVSAYHNALSTARNEYARVISMATGAQGITDHAMKEGLKLFPDDLAPAQFESNYAIAQQDMANRTAAMHDQIAKAKATLHGAPAPTPTAGAPAGGTAPANGATPMSLDQYLKSKGF
jgi:hypothetical protein